jgi:hypothetical protein
VKTGAAASIYRTFVTADDHPPSTYQVFGSKLHVLKTWEAFLAAGGSPDMSNVRRVPTLRNNLDFGSPVA